MNVSRKETFYLDEDPVVILVALEGVTIEAARSCHNIYIQMGIEEDHVHYIYNPDNQFAMVKVEAGNVIAPSKRGTPECDDLETSLLDTVEVLFPEINHEIFWYDDLYHGKAGMVSNHLYLENHQIVVTKDAVEVFERVGETEGFQKLIEFPYVSYSGHLLSDNQ